MITIANLLTTATKRLTPASDSARLDAEVLLAWTLGLNRTELQANETATVDLNVTDYFQQIINLRRRGVPVAYITGRQPFMDFEVEVTPHTLIPRPFTETLVTAMLDHLGDDRHVVADIGTGSGAIALALARYRPNSRIIGTDVSVPALQVAAANARRLGLLRQIDWRIGSLLTPLRADDQVDGLIANLPYLPDDGLTEPSLQHEPALALAGGPDGLRYIRAFIEQLKAQPHVRLIALELLPEQIDAVSHDLRLADWQSTPISDGQSYRGLLSQREQHPDLSQGAVDRL